MAVASGDQPVPVCDPASGCGAAPSAEAGAATIAAEAVAGRAGRDLPWAGRGRAGAGDCARLGRAPSTVCREVAANGGRDRYRACAADRRAVRGMRRPKPAKLARCPRLREAVESKLELRWSPQQIAAWLRISYPDDPEMRVSRETIYLSLFVQSKGALRKELARYLRRGRARRRPRGLPVNNGQGQLRGTVHISQRPAEAGDRAVPGHWEGDLLFGTRSSTVATLVERKSRFVMLVGLPGGHTAGVVADALADAITSLPSPAAPVHHLGPGQGDGRTRPLQRGDGGAGLLLRSPQPLAAWQQREHQRAAAPVLPRSTDFRALTQRDLDAVAAELNDRPRQTLGWKSPCQALDEALR